MLITLLAFIANMVAQRDYYRNFSFTYADSLRGSLRPERTCFDVTYYDLNLNIDIPKQFIRGFVDVHFNVVEDFNVMQLDLFRNMKIVEVIFYEQPVTYRRIYDAFFVHLPIKLTAGSQAYVRVVFEGFPQTAKNAPWDGGFVWSKDLMGNPWVGVACEGTGASLWWPNKDHLSDEPDSVSIKVIIPDGLSVVANGNLRKAESQGNGYTLHDWFVSYPINNYNVTVNIGKYTNLKDTYIAKDGDSLAIDYYVLDYNTEKAKAHFAQVKPMLACFEKYFGKYPFWNDGYALVETPYLGMEHQSALAYGNEYNRGYLGGMIPRDMNWDYIIVHESAHEYFGNAVSVRDHGEIWLHESLTTYMEALYVECTFGYADAVRYLESQKPFIRNLDPINGPRDVNWDNYSGNDHYFKGAQMIHTLRNGLDDDELFFGILRGFYEQYKYKVCQTEDFITYVKENSNKDLTGFFEQYLWHPNYPRFDYELRQKDKDLKVAFRWVADVSEFGMPIKIGKSGDYRLVYPQVGKIKEITLKDLTKSEFMVATELFYVRKKEAKGLFGRKGLFRKKVKEEDSEL